SIGLIAISTMSVIALVFAWATYRTNQLWRWAGRELQAVRQQTVDLTASLKSDEKLIVLGIPKYSGGAPVNINSSTLLLMLRPPFTKPAVSRQVITFDSFVVSPADVFKTEIFKRLIRNKRVKGPYVWNHDKLKFDIVSLTPGQEDTKDLVLPFEATEENSPQWQFISNKAAKAQISPDCIDLSDTTSGDQLKIENLQASPLDYNFLEFYIDVKPSPDQSQNLIPLILSWNDIKDKKPENNFALSVVDLKRVKENPRFLIQVSRYWSWFANSKINSLTLHLPKTKAISICKAQLINGDKFIPKIWLKDRLPLNSGEYLIEKWVPVTVLFNGSSNTSAKATEIEISKPNYFFDNRLRGTDSGSAVAWRLTVNAPKGLTDIHPNLFTEPGYYEVRMRSLDEKKNPLGAWSDAITILKLGKGNNVYIDPNEFL
ncbi:MAG: hypothetical protein K2Z81_26965, partial [Cyanobacteria bacterium]|nr:hypothetical protein [Cyanobacteriota bacterium]